MVQISIEIEELKEALINIERVQVRNILNEAIAKNSQEKAEHLLVQAFESIGNDWENGDAALSQLYMSGRICEEIIGEFASSGTQKKPTQPKMAIAVLEDFHGLGKRIVQSALGAAGYKVEDFGLGVAVKDLAHRVQKEEIEILLISALMLPSALAVGQLVAHFKEENYPIKILVGGAPFRLDPNLWQEVGATATAGTASEVVGALEKLILEAP